MLTEHDVEAGLELMAEFGWPSRDAAMAVVDAENGIDTFAPTPPHIQRLYGDLESMLNPASTS